MFGLIISSQVYNLKTSHPDKTGNQKDYFFPTSLTPITMKPILRHDSKHWIVTTNARSNFFVILFGVAYLVELRLQMKTYIFVKVKNLPLLHML